MTPQPLLVGVAFTAVVPNGVYWGLSAAAYLFLNAPHTREAAWTAWVAMAGGEEAVPWRYPPPEGGVRKLQSGVATTFAETRGVLLVVMRNQALTVPLFCLYAFVVGPYPHPSHSSARSCTTSMKLEIQLNLRKGKRVESGHSYVCTNNIKCVSVLAE